MATTSEFGPSILARLAFRMSPLGHRVLQGEGAHGRSAREGQHDERDVREAG